MPCVPLPPGPHVPQCHVEVPRCPFMLCVDCIICVLTAACVWVRLRVVCVPRALCSAHSLHVHPGTQESRAGRVPSACSLQRSAAGPAVSARRALADGLDLPNASRTNKTFRSGIARGARRQASAEMLRLWIVWAGGVLCRGLSAAPSTPFLPSWVRTGWETVSLLHTLLQTSSSGGKVRKVDGCLTPAAWESQTEQGWFNWHARVEKREERKERRKEKSKWRREAEQERTGKYR